MKALAIAVSKSFKDCAYNACIIMLFCLFPACSPKKANLDTLHKYIKPQYNSLKVFAMTDTIIFPLDDNSFNIIKSFNLFTHENKEYISFYDERSKSILIYNFESKILVKKIPLKKILADSKLNKITVYTRNFDSIFLANFQSLYLLDSSRSLAKSTDFLDGSTTIRPQFENTNPPVLLNGRLYAGVRPNVKPTSRSALKDWKILYRFDLKEDKKSLFYHLPEIYQNNFFGYHFLNYSYCYNEQGNFIFSFPADPNIYVSDLNNYNYSYLARSQNQVEEILPAAKSILENVDKSFKDYLTKDSYGAIYFDHLHKRYLRVAKSKMTEKDFEENNRRRKSTFVILNDQFKIIGEAEIPDGISYKEICFTAFGKMYARINVGNEYSLQFVELVYGDSTLNVSRIAKK